MRASECVALRLRARSTGSARRAFIRHGKGEKQRWVGFGPRTAAALRSYVAEYRGDLPGALFLTTDFEPMTSAHSLCVLLQRLGAKAGVVGVHPHRFRHTFATWAIESGAREIDVQMLLGHSDLTMTQRYARTYTSEQAVRAHVTLSPVEPAVGATDRRRLRDGVRDRLLRAVPPTTRVSPGSASTRAVRLAAPLQPPARS